MLTCAAMGNLTSLDAYLRAAQIWAQEALAAAVIGGAEAIDLVDGAGT